MSLSPIGIGVAVTVNTSEEYPSILKLTKKQTGTASSPTTTNPEKTLVIAYVEGLGRKVSDPRASYITKFFLQDAPLVIRR